MFGIWGISSVFFVANEHYGLRRTGLPTLVSVPTWRYDLEAVATSANLAGWLRICVSFSASYTLSRSQLPIHACFVQLSLLQLQSEVICVGAESSSRGKTSFGRVISISCAYEKLSIAEKLFSQLLISAISLFFQSPRSEPWKPSCCTCYYSDPSLLISNAAQNFLSPMISRPLWSFTERLVNGRVSMDVVWRQLVSFHSVTHFSLRRFGRYHEDRP